MPKAIITRLFPLPAKEVCQFLSVHVSDLCRFSSIAAGCHAEHDIPSGRECDGFQKPPFFIAQPLHLQEFELLDHLFLNLQLQRPRDTLRIVRSLQRGHILYNGHQIDHITRFAIFKCTELFLVRSQIIDET